MKSISKLLEIRKSAKVSKVEHAVIVTGSAHYVKRQASENLRGADDADGRIKGLSKNALSRLRDAIARTAHESGDYSVYGCCLTIPWGNRDPLDPSNPTQEEAAQIWREFVHHLDRLLDFLDCGIIYRVELQERRAVHWHLMVYLPNAADRFEDINAKLIALSRKHRGLAHVFWHMGKKRGYKPMFDIPMNAPINHAASLTLIRANWILANVRAYAAIKAARADRAAEAPVAPSPLTAAPAEIRTWDFCMDAISLDGVKSGVAYLASHTTKHKQDQLGYTGKQWGYLGKSHLKQAPEEWLDADMSIETRVRAYRLIRKWVKRNRTKSDYRICIPRRVLLENGEYIYTGLVTRNIRQIYLFGTPREVAQCAFESAMAQLDKGEYHG